MCIKGSPLKVCGEDNYFYVMELILKIKKTKIKVIHADITTLCVDAIVNAANNELWMGGGVAGVIKKAGGESIEQEAVSKGPINIGGAIATGSGKLPCKYVIHAATMGMDFQTDSVKIRQSCASALKVAEELKLASISFPALGCGVGKFNKKLAARIMFEEIIKVAIKDETTLEEISYCLYDAPAYEEFKAYVEDCYYHFREDLGWGPYFTTDCIVEMSEGIVMIDRGHPPFGWAIPGGFMERGESAEESVRREIMEETGLELENLRQFHTYSNPSRDPRFHTVTTTFIATGIGTPRFGDDAAGIKIVPYHNLLEGEYAFDHMEIIRDYLAKKY